MAKNVVKRPAAMKTMKKPVAKNAAKEKSRLHLLLLSQFVHPWPQACIQRSNDGFAFISLNLQK